jgi:bifunctional pyridoxal-dependent enzyme with beta-cystathionase and maltose regulon repressor activities
MSEPAAWFYQYPGETGIFMCADAKAMEGLEEKGYILTPLYTHPAKTLTDEEIDSIWAEMSEQCDEEFIDMKQFARAILKKASEK